jgi:hypothetical protein
MAGSKISQARMGLLPPRYSFLLNPHQNEAFTRCPRCKAKTRIRKLVLVIHVDSVGLILLRKTCRLCIVCEMLIAHEAELDRLISGFDTHGIERREYIVLGTLDPKTWSRGVSGSVTVDEVAGTMADFEAYMRVDITPRHWSRKSDTAE